MASIISESCPSILSFHYMSVSREIVHPVYPRLLLYFWHERLLTADFHQKNGHFMESYGKSLLR
ncbi:MAG: hypothetical protein K0Q90_1814 [Paenibacillaceae bacterium]|nr:hypothetical protein [Paenibacillaceae bacterium]